MEPQETRIRAGFHPRGMREWEGGSGQGKGWASKPPILWWPTGPGLPGTFRVLALTVWSPRKQLSPRQTMTVDKKKKTTWHFPCFPLCYWWVIHGSEGADTSICNMLNCLSSKEAQFQRGKHHAEFSLIFRVLQALGWLGWNWLPPVTIWGPQQGSQVREAAKGSGLSLRPGCSLSGCFSSWYLCTSTGQHLWWNGEVVREEGRMGEGVGKDPVTAKWVQKV